MDLKHFQCEDEDMSAYICVEKYLIKSGCNKVVTELQETFKLKIVFDYLTKTSHVWIQKLLGAHLSQGFVHHRVAYQFYYTTLIGLKMRKGSFGEEENEKLLEFEKKHNENPTTNDWKAKM